MSDPSDSEPPKSLATDLRSAEELAQAEQIKNIFLQPNAGKEDKSDSESSSEIHESQDSEAEEEALLVK